MTCTPIYKTKETPYAKKDSPYSVMTSPYSKLCAEDLIVTPQFLKIDDTNYLLINGHKLNINP